MKFFTIFLFLFLFGCNNIDNNVSDDETIKDTDNKTTENLDLNKDLEIDVNYSEREQLCMSVILYYESRGEIEKGIYAVGEVVLNRVNSPNYPNSICKVLEQPYQFSFYSPGIFQEKRNPESFNKVLKIKDKLLSDDYEIQYIGNATGFVVSGMPNKPKWTEKATKTYVIGNHTFYEF